MVWSWGNTGRLAWYRTSSATSLPEDHVVDVDSGSDLVVERRYTDPFAGFLPNDSGIVLQTSSGFRARKADGWEPVELPRGTFGYMADGEHLAALHDTVFSLQALGEPPRTVWTGSSDFRIDSMRFPSKFYWSPPITP